MSVKKLGLKQRYAHMTRGLDWETTYQPMDKVFPYDTFEGIKIQDWSTWEDPFRLTMDTYWKYQAEKERKLYAVIDAFAQNNGHLGLTDARYINALKLFLTGVSPLEYRRTAASPSSAAHLRGVGPRVACQMQSLDEIRHAQTQIHTISHYNKYYNGFHEFRHMHDRVWYLSVPKSFFDDANTAGPFEFMIAIGFSFEYVLTNLLFVPFMSGAAYNGDMATVTFGFSAQSDESAAHDARPRGHQVHARAGSRTTCPSCRRWIDKWFWRGHRVLTLVAMMMDYMLPKRVMSWKEAWEIYFDGTAARCSRIWPATASGCRSTRTSQPPRRTTSRTRTGRPSTSTRHAAAFHTWMPDDEHLDWLSEKYPSTFDKLLPAALGDVGEDGEGRQALLQHGAAAALPGLPDPDGVHRAGRSDDDLLPRASEYKGDKYHFCSDGCKDIFDNEPEKYVQAWLPVHQIYQGNCGGATVPDVLAWYKMNVGADNMDYVGSPDEKLWNEWHAKQALKAG